jgi:hypothetical protein
MEMHPIPSRAGSTSQNIGSGTRAIVEVLERSFPITTGAIEHHADMLRSLTPVLIDAGVAERAVRLSIGEKRPRP